MFQNKLFLVILTIIGIIAISAVSYFSPGVNPEFQLIQTVQLYPINETIPANEGSVVAKNIFYRTSETENGVVSDALGFFASHTVMETDKISPCYQLYKDKLNNQHIIYFVPEGKKDEYLQIR